MLVQHYIKVIHFFVFTGNPYTRCHMQHRDTRAITCVRLTCCSYGYGCNVWSSTLYDCTFTSLSKKCILFPFKIVNIPNTAIYLYVSCPGQGDYFKAYIRRYQLHMSPIVNISRNVVFVFSPQVMSHIGVRSPVVGYCKFFNNYPISIADIIQP